MQPDSFLIEVEDEPVGIIVDEPAGMVFHAVHPAVVALHGRVFADTVEAARAAQHSLRKAA